MVAGTTGRLCPLDRPTQMADPLADGTPEMIAEAGYPTTLEQPEASNAARARWLDA